MPRLLTHGDAPSPMPATEWPASSRNGGRHQIGTLAGFASEWVAGFRRNPHARDVAVVSELVSSLARRDLMYLDRQVG
jgi:hypothetical protein